MDNKRFVLLFGLSANPPTGMSGHAGIVAWASGQSSFPELDGLRPEEIWVLPVFRHAFEDKREMPSFEHRVAMAKLAFEALPNAKCPVRVLTTERDVADQMIANVRDMHTPSVRVGTIDVVRHLRAQYPEVTFAILLGGDTYEDLIRGRWKESGTLQNLVRVIMVPRKIGPSGHPSHPIGTQHPTLSPISSTEVRATSNLTLLERVLQPAVLAYIQQHQLYAFARPTSGNDTHPPI